MRRVIFAAVCSALTAGPAMAADRPLGGGLFEVIVTGGNARAPLRTTVPAEVDSSQILGATFISAAVGTAETVAPFSALEPRRMVEIAPSEEIGIHAEIPPQFLRQEVAYVGPERPGVIVIDTSERFLFLVEPGGRALRYGIGVGRPGFDWGGVRAITRKVEWADPLGNRARVLYLGSSRCQIRGADEPWSTGDGVSSECIRMRNEDVIDLYVRVRVGTKVIVM